MSNQFNFRDGRCDNHDGSKNSRQRFDNSSSSGEEDIIDGFAIASYSSVAALEARVAADNHQRNRIHSNAMENGISIRKRKHGNQISIPESNAVDARISNTRKTVNEDEFSDSAGNDKGKDGRRILKDINDRERIPESTSISGKLSVASIIGNSSSDSDSTRSKNQQLNRGQSERITHTDQSLRNGGEVAGQSCNQSTSQVSGKWCNAHVRVAHLIQIERSKFRNLIDSQKDSGGSTSGRAQPRESKVTPFGVPLYPGVHQFAGYPYMNLSSAASQNGQVASPYDIPTSTNPTLRAGSLHNFPGIYQHANLSNIVSRDDLTSMQSRFASTGGGNWGNLSRVQPEPLTVRPEVRSPDSSQSSNSAMIEKDPKVKSNVRNDSVKEERITRNRDTPSDDAEFESTDKNVKEESRNTSGRSNKETNNTDKGSKTDDRDDTPGERRTPVAENSKFGNHKMQVDRCVKDYIVRGESPRTRPNESDVNIRKVSNSHLIDSMAVDPSIGLPVGHSARSSRANFATDGGLTFNADMAASAASMMNHFDPNQLYRNLYNQCLQPGDYSQPRALNVPQPGSPYIDQRQLSFLAANSSLSPYGIDATTAYYLSQQHGVPGYAAQFGSAVSSNSYPLDLRKLEQANSMIFGGLASGISSQRSSPHQNRLPSIASGLPSRMTAPGMPGSSSGKATTASSLDRFQFAASPAHVQPSYSLAPPSGEGSLNPINTLPIITSYIPGYQNYKPDRRDDRST